MDSVLPSEGSYSGSIPDMSIKKKPWRLPRLFAFNRFALEQLHDKFVGFCVNHQGVAEIANVGVALEDLHDVIGV